MPYDKIKDDGTIIKAPDFTNRVLDSVPVLFQLAEWLLIIVAFQFVDIKFGFIVAKIAWMLLSFALAMYVGVLGSNILWRTIEDPFKTKKWNIFTTYIFPLLVACLVLGLHYLIEKMVTAQLS